MIFSKRQNYNLLYRQIKKKSVVQKPISIIFNTSNIPNVAFEEGKMRFSQSTAIKGKKVSKCLFIQMQKLNLLGLWERKNLSKLPWKLFGVGKDSLFHWQALVLTKCLDLFGAVYCKLKVYDQKAKATSTPPQASR